MEFCPTIEIDHVSNGRDKFYHSSRRESWYRCKTCNQSFLREGRYISMPHKCPLYINGKKKCGSCDNYLELGNFRKNSSSSSGLNSYCRVCSSSKVEAQRYSTLESWIKTILKSKKNDKRKLLVDIDESYLIELWNNQQGLCYYTSIPMDWRSRKSELDSASLERIDPSAGYEVGNVVWCCFAINVMKNKSSIENFVEFVRKWKFCSSFTPIEHDKTHLFEGKYEENLLFTKASLDDYQTIQYSMEETAPRCYQANQGSQ